MDLQPVRAGLLAAAATLGVLLTVALWRAAERASGVVTIVVVSVFAAAACEPAVNRLARRGWRRGIAAGLLLGTVVAIVAVAAAAVGAAAAAQAEGLRDALPELAASLQRVAADRFGVQVNLDALIARIDRFDVSVAAAGAAGTALQILGKVLAGLLVTFYLVVDGPRLRKALCSVLPARHQGEVLRVWDLAVEKTGGYLASKVVLAGISTVVHAVAFSALGVPYPLPMAVWLGVVSQIVPIIGTYLAIGLPVVLAVTQRDPVAAVGAVVAATIYQQVENTVLGPRLTGQAVQIHPAVGFVGVLAVGAAFGPVYTLLAVPFIATIQGFAAAYVRTHDLIDDPRLQTPVETTAAKPARRARPERGATSRRGSTKRTGRRSGRRNDAG